MPGDPPTPTLDTFVHDRHDGTTVRVDLSGNGPVSEPPALSHDGRYVACPAHGSGVTPDDTSLVADVFLLDRVSGSLERVSLGTGGIEPNNDSGGARLSADARIVVFQTPATNLVAGAASGFNVYARDRVAGTTVLVNVSSAGVPGNTGASQPAISADGRFVAFASRATNLVVPNDPAPLAGIFVHDLATGATERVSVDANGDPGNRASSRPSISGDGRFVTFETASSDLAPGDTNALEDVFVRDRLAGTTTRASVGALGTQANGASSDATISADGRWIAFPSQATNLVPGVDANVAQDVFLHDRTTGVTSRVSVAPDGSGAAGGSLTVALSADGRFVGFSSSADNLTFAPATGVTKLFLRDLASAPAFDIYCDAKTNSAGCVPVIGASGIPSFAYTDGFRVLAQRVINGQPGVLLFGLGAAVTPFGGGTLCIQAPVSRTPGQIASGNQCATGALSAHYSFPFTQASFAEHNFVPGTTVYAQVWSRDPGFVAPNNVGLTDALRFTVCP